VFGQNRRFFQPLPDVKRGQVAQRWSMKPRPSSKTTMPAGLRRLAKRTLSTNWLTAPRWTRRFCFLRAFTSVKFGNLGSAAALSSEFPNQIMGSKCVAVLARCFVTGWPKFGEERGISATRTSTQLARRGDQRKAVRARAASPAYTSTRFPPYGTTFKAKGLPPPLKA
jgi:hypothetical protein